MLILTEGDDGKSFDLPVGATMRISVAENASTGYRWAVDHADQNVLAAGPSQAGYPDPTPGSGGRVAFDFTAKAAGDAQLSLKYWRHWEGDASAIGHFRVRIRVS